MRRHALISVFLLIAAVACGPDGFDSLDVPESDDEVLLTEFVPPADEGGEETGGQGMGTGEMPPPDMPAEDDPAEGDLWCCDCETGHCSPVTPDGFCVDLDGSLITEPVYCMPDEGTGNLSECLEQC